MMKCLSLSFLGLPVRSNACVVESLFLLKSSLKPITACFLVALFLLFSFFQPSISKIATTVECSTQFATHRYPRSLQLDI